MKALVGAFNQEKDLVGAFSVIVKPIVKPMDHFTALMVTPAAAAQLQNRCGRKLQESQTRDGEL